MNDKPTSSSNENLPLTVLFKFIKSYDGNRDKLCAFLTNCDRAVALAAPHQQNTLLSFILTSLEGQAEVICANHVTNNWSELKDLLKRSFGERKHYAHLLLELQNCKQFHTEGVSQYILRIENCIKNLLVSVNQNNKEPAEMLGRTASIQELGMQTFMYGTNPQIATILRSRNPKDLNEAFTISLEEERINKLMNKSKSNYNVKSCNIKNEKNKIHHNFDKRKVMFVKNNIYNNKSYHQNSGQNNNNNNFTNKSYGPNSGQYNNKMCRYCKKPGHSRRVHNFNIKMKILIQILQLIIIIRLPYQENMILK